jgi:excisionase family DNA binding protein
VRKVHEKTERCDEEMNKVPIWEKANLTVAEAAEYSNIGINKLYEMVNNPLCDYVLHVGKKTLIKRKSFEKFLERNIEI